MYKLLISVKPCRASAFKVLLPLNVPPVFLNDCSSISLFCIYICDSLMIPSFSCSYLYIYSSIPCISLSFYSLSSFSIKWTCVIFFISRFYKCKSVFSNFNFRISIYVSNRFCLFELCILRSIF
jgi:hypothetical protein